MQRQVRTRNLKMDLCAVALAGALAIGSASPASAAECRSAADADAVHLRSLQSELMVAALSCRAKPLYNAFAGRFEAVLVDSGVQLRRMFQRYHDGNGTRALNRFITLLGNDASARGIAQGNRLCPLSAALFDEVMTLKPKALAGYSYQRTFNSRAVPETCKTEAAIAHKR